MDIHKRRIQQFAKYSYAVTLPIHWIKRNHLDKPRASDKKANHVSQLATPNLEPVVNLFEMSDGSLQIYPDLPSEAKEENMALLDLDDMLKQNPAFIEEKVIQMLLISYYMNGFTGVEIVSKNPIPDEFVNQVERTQDRLLFNWNTSRINAFKILIKNVFSETPENIFQEEIPRYLRESFIILLGIIEDIESSLKDKNYEILASIPARDSKIDRYYFFIVRQIRTIFDNPQISKPLNYNHKKLVDLRLLSKLIEDVGDLLKESSETIYSLQKFITAIDLQPYLLDFFKTLRESYEILADLLAKWVLQKESQSQMKLKIMPHIQLFRQRGKILFLKWEEISAKFKINDLNFAFQDYYRGSSLIYSIRDVYDKLFDFTNLFF
jgi:phosphate uptake regulator